tara:strand:- start:83 stop:856 length:774 start_codon:yes stop_codon:yes gene_type:complete
MFLDKILVQRGLVALRQSFDWSRIKTVDDLSPEKFDEKVLHPVGTTRRSVEAWNKAFNKSFFQTRHELKQLTLSNLRSLRNTDVELLSRRTKISAWRVMLLSDDDDWVAPAWTQDLPEARQGLLFCRWQSVRFNGAWYIRPNSRKFSFTNNYCTFPQARKLYSLSQVYQHFDQNEIHNQLEQHQVAYIGRPLTVTHKHPASANTMRQLLLDSDWDIGVLRDSVRNYLEDNRTLKIPDSLHWASGLVEASSHIFSALL